MGATLSSTFTDPQRRLLNTLVCSDVPHLGAPVRYVVEKATADYGDLVALEDAEVIEALRFGAEQIEIAHTPMLQLTRDGNTLRLTNMGIHWVVNSAENKLLRRIDAAPRGRYDLRDASRDCDDDNIIMGVVANGYATLHFKGDQQETQFVGDGRRQFAHGGDYVLIPTVKMRRVLGPERATQ